MYQSDKSTVFDYITQNFISTSSNSTQTVVADGMLIVKNTINQICLTFALFARIMLMKFLKLTNYRADLCFDVYEPPSIKDTKRKDRGNEETERNFTFGPRQKYPTYIDNLLQISEFKKEFLKVLMNEYEDPVYAHIIGDKIFYCSVDNICKKCYVHDGTLKIEEVYELYGYHLEADTRVAFHAFHADSVRPGNIVVRGNDTDILVILPCNADKFSSNIWLDAGLDYNNSRKFINIKSLCQSLSYSHSVPAIYAFIGIDYMPSFYGKGKVRPIKLTKSQTRFSNAFKDLGEKEIDDLTVNIIEEFVCHMYDYKKQTSIHQVLPIVFGAKCKPKQKGQPLDSIKNIDPKTFPPCRRVLLEQIKRAWYISRLYKTATTAYPAEQQAEIDYGWKLSDDNEFLDIKWFEGKQVPAAIENIEELENSDEEVIDDGHSDQSDYEDY